MNTRIKVVFTLYMPDTVWKAEPFVRFPPAGENEHIHRGVLAAAKAQTHTLKCQGVRRQDGEELRVNGYGHIVLDLVVCGGKTERDRRNTNVDGGTCGGRTTRVRLQLLLLLCCCRHIALPCSVAINGTK